MATQNAPTPSAQAGFKVPAKLSELNSILAADGLPSPLSATAYRMLLERLPHATLIRGLMAVYNGGQSRKNATAYLTKALNDVLAAEASGERPVCDADRFVEPRTLGAFRAMFAKHNLAQDLSKAQMDILLQSVGRAELVAALRAVHNGESDRQAAFDMLSREAATAAVRIERGDVAHSRSNPADDLPPDSSEDAGFDGLHRAPAAPTPARAPSRVPATPVPARHDRSNAAADDHAANHPQRPQARAYGKRAALCVEATDDGTQGPTLMVEMAPSTGKEREYDWKGGKMRFQLMQKELLEVIAVLFEYAPGAEFANHGDTRVKSLTLQNQEGGRLYVKLSDKEKPMLVIPVTEKDMLAKFAGLAVAQALKVFPGHTDATLLSFVRQRVAPSIKPVQAARSSNAYGGH